jgi:flagellum-specific peptidoglycan hydrolase FlgJ
MGRVGSREEYFNLLSQSYAEDPMYVTKLKNEIIKRNLSKYF